MGNTAGWSSGQLGRLITFRSAVRIRPPLQFLSRLGNRVRKCHYYKFNFNNAVAKDNVGCEPQTRLTTSTEDRYARGQR